MERGTSARVSDECNEVPAIGPEAIRMAIREVLLLGGKRGSPAAVGAAGHEDVEYAIPCHFGLRRAGAFGSVLLAFRHPAGLTPLSPTHIGTDSSALHRSMIRRRVGRQRAAAPLCSGSGLHFHFEHHWRQVDAAASRETRDLHGCVMENSNVETSWRDHVSR